MKLKLVGRVMDVFEGDSANHVTFLDTEQGGQIKLALPKSVKPKIDQLLNVEGEVKPGIGKSGMYLQIKNLTKGGE